MYGDMKNGTIRLTLLAILALALPAPGTAQGPSSVFGESVWSLSYAEKQVYPRSEMYRQLTLPYRGTVSWSILPDKWERDGEESDGLWLKQRIDFGDSGSIQDGQHLLLHLEGAARDIAVRINGGPVTERDGSGAFDLTAAIVKTSKLVSPPARTLSLRTVSGEREWDQAWLEWVDYTYLSSVVCRIEGTDLLTDLLMDVTAERTAPDDVLEVIVAEMDPVRTELSGPVRIPLSSRIADVLPTMKYPVTARIVRDGKTLDEVFCSFPAGKPFESTPDGGHLVLKGLRLYDLTSGKPLGRGDVPEDTFRRYRAAITAETIGGLVLLGDLAVLRSGFWEDDAGKVRYDLSWGEIGLSGALAVIGLSTFFYGRTALVKIRDEYNGMQSSLSMGPTRNGWGLALRF